MGRKTEELKHKIGTLKARNKELDSLFERTHEDSVSGKITEERFAKMSRKYETEQSENETALATLGRELLTANNKSNAAKNFLATVKLYTRMRKLSPEILRQFVDKIVVHHRRRVSIADKDSPASEEQQIEIFYNCVGKIGVPDIAKVPAVEINLTKRKGVAVNYSYRFVHADNSE